MGKLKRILTVVFCIAGTLTIALSLTAYCFFGHHYKGTYIEDEDWWQTDFDIGSVSTVEKDKDKDFVILNLADVQLKDFQKPKVKAVVHKEISYLVKTYKPDLITLTGDQTQSDYNLVSLKSLISWLDSYKVPYAPIFGNHDSGDDFNSAVASERYCCDLYEKGKYSLFKRGPSDIGNLGNYAVNITEDGRIVKTLYMMNLGKNYDLTRFQKGWFKWVANGIKKYNNDVYSDAMVFTHKDVGYESAYKYYLENPDSAEGTVYKFEHFSSTREADFVELAKSCGVSDFLCGHEHANNFTINYNNARFTFCLKTGETCYWYEKDDVYLNGATEMRINKDDTSIVHHFVEPGKFVTGVKNNL